MKLSLSEYLLIDFINQLDECDLIDLLSDQSLLDIREQFPFLQQYFLGEFYYNNNRYSRHLGYHPILMKFNNSFGIDKIYPKMSNPSLKSKRLMLKIDSSLIKLIKNPSKSLITQSLSYSGNNIRYIKNQTELLCLMALNRNATAIMGINNITDTIFNSFIQTDEFLEHPNYFVENFIIEKTNLTPVMLKILGSFVNNDTLQLLKTHKNWKTDAKIVLDKFDE